MHSAALPELTDPLGHSRHPEPSLEYVPAAQAVQIAPFASGAKPGLHVTIDSVTKNTVSATALSSTKSFNSTGSFWYTVGWQRTECRDVRPAGKSTAMVAVASNAAHNHNTRRNGKHQNTRA